MTVLARERASGEHGATELRPAAPGTVSVIIPSYNGSRFVGRAIESVLRQTHAPDQIIVADDGSRDDTLGIIEKFRRRSQGRLILLGHPSGGNRGIAETYQLAISKADGEYLAFLEQDDRWPADHIARKLAIFDSRPGVGVVFSPYRVVGSNLAGWEMRLRQRLLTHRLPKREAFDNFRHLIDMNNVATLSCVVARRDLVQRVPAPPTIPMYFFDWWMFCHLSTRAPFLYDHRSSVSWRVSRRSALGAVSFGDLRVMVADFLRVLYRSLLDDEGLSAKHRAMLSRHVASLPHFVALFTDPRPGTAARFLAADPVWATRCLASLLVNSVKHRR